jgi:hypothetical protein
LNTLDDFARIICLPDHADEYVGIAWRDLTGYLDNHAPVFVREALYRR